MTQSGPIGSFKNALETKDKKGGGLFGIIPVLGAFGIAVGYAVVVGWFIKFLVGSISGEALNAIDSGAYFVAIAGPFGSVMWHFLALLITALILLLGVSNGIEKVNKIMMPTFYILFLLLLVRVLMLDGAKDGINYLFVPKWEYLSQPKTWIYALGQAFFSLSIAGSGMIVY
ncbi:sodium-dependent transporter, partial [Clostridioides difficile]|nr:sodium-dependent transporter [Clostridioides difficile]